MSNSFTEHTTVQKRILEYASQIGWQLLSQAETEKLRHFDTSSTLPAERAKNSYPFLKDFLLQKVMEFNPKYSEKDNNLFSKLNGLRTDIHGNKDFLQYLKGEKTFFSSEDNREYNLKLIDFDNPSNNTYHISEEYYFNNSRYGNREDVVFFINGIPVIFVECKNATKDEALAIGIDQIRRYHRETPGMLIPQQIFTVTEAIGLLYGVTWNTNRKNLFYWKAVKDENEIGNLESKVKTFFDIRSILAFLKNYILFVEKDEELNKFILRQHQVEAVEKVVERALDDEKKRGLVWHTQGSGKTYTIIKSAEILFKHPQADKPTIILLIDRNELEDQMIRNLRSLGIENVKHANSIAAMRDLLREDYRGLILSMIHKFNDMPPDINKRQNIYVLVDEAHRTTSGDLGNYLMAAIPNATLIGFTGTPIDKTAYGRGTFKTFGIDDPKGYLDKYSISASINDGTTLPLYYSLAPNELRVPEEILEKEFLKLAEAEGVSDIEELNKILEKAVQTKNFLKGKRRINKIGKFVAEHYKTYVENLGYKAFLVGVDREACALYKKALDKYLPTEYSQVVYTAGYNDTEELKEYHLDKDEEKTIRKNFAKSGTLPKILIVTEKLLTGYDAPVLYTMYLDKPMRDHTLLQAIARVNRPYEDEEGKKKPFGLVIDFIGIFDKLEKALAFDSDDVKSVIRDLVLLKESFRKHLEKQAPKYLNLIKPPYSDKEVDKLIEHFKSKSKRKEFFKFFKEVEMLYEIISPDAFLRPYMENYKLLTQIYYIVRNAYANKVYVDKEFQRKTIDLVKETVDITNIESVTDAYELDAKTIELIKEGQKPDNVKVINLIKTILRQAEEHSGDLVLISIKDKALAIQENYENRIITTKAALEELEALVKEIINQEEEKKAKGFDDLTFFFSKKLSEYGLSNSDNIAKSFIESFKKYPNWKQSEAETRELRQDLYLNLLSEIDDIDKANQIIDELFNIILKANE
ncbi:MAG: type I deoxyribonuclease HsdR [Ignavibacterium sp.]|uniref:type I restriction endonuclease subunit R n=1 Tax=Ignavibacterium sp. TaxID=2651167 RepID=UPI0021DD5B4D|nr:HsdR family type I site-specific deoxyribonuclease [Ignavibacterium sp.]BDQ02085.1 MAG: type I deoxyribonuclease HsdR [Ignavibacterium sp.]GIV46234.1 MAG: type I deoxyribonuclease HsdR [Ignavibacterium sp.]